MDGLTRMEIAVVNELKRGMQNKMIASRLGIMESTVKVHLRNVARKLNASSRSHIALWAHEQADRSNRPG